MTDHALCASSIATCRIKSAGAIALRQENRVIDKQIVLRGGIVYAIDRDSTGCVWISNLYARPGTINHPFHREIGQADST